MNIIPILAVLLKLLTQVFIQSPIFTHEQNSPTLTSLCQVTAWQIVKIALNFTTFGLFVFNCFWGLLTEVNRTLLFDFPNLIPYFFHKI